LEGSIISQPIEIIKEIFYRRGVALFSSWKKAKKAVNWNGYPLGKRLP
jgi:hypothetical protein